jgi:5-methylcytosine-specific restriction endonuclease McrA
MQQHTKNYYKAFGYGIDDVILCEVCGAKAVDIHHICGRGKGKDELWNLIALCRECHNKAHANLISKEYLKQIVARRNKY